MGPQAVASFSNLVEAVSSNALPSEQDDIALAMWTRRTIEEFSDAGKGQAGARPVLLIDRYVLCAMRAVVVERLEDLSYFAEIPGFQGVWADGRSGRVAERELEAALRAWVELKIEHGDRDLPVVGGIDLNVL
jgi:predicted RNase H-like HicB family nuclease